MQNNRVLSLFSLLSKTEITDFQGFLNSPVFNKNADVARLFSLYAAICDKQSDIPGKEELFAALYPGKPYEARRIGDLTYYLNRLLKEYLCLVNFRKDSYGQKIGLLKEATDRKAGKLATETITELKEMQAASNSDSTYFYNEYLLQRGMDTFAFSDGRKPEIDAHLQAKVDNLDVFYMTVKLKESCEMLNRMSIMHTSYSFFLLDEVLQHLNTHADRYTPYSAIAIYKNILMMLREPADEAYFRNLIGLLDEHGHKFSGTELREMYNYAQNYCILKINEGFNEYYGSLFNIYIRMLQDDLILENNTLTEWDYKNIVSLGLRTGAAGWTLDFIQSYKNKLPEDKRNNAYTYNLANYYFETGSYDKAIRLLRSVEFTDVYYNLGAKCMLLKIYFDQEEDEPFHTLLAAFRMYLRRNKLISSHTTLIYLNLLRFSKKLFTLKTKLPYQRKKNYWKEVHEVKTTLAGQKNTANLQWLLSKAAALEEMQNAG